MLLDLWPLLEERPATQPVLTGPAFQPHRRPAPIRGRGRLRVVVTLAASGRTSGSGATQVRTSCRMRPRPLSGTQRLALTAGVDGTPRALRDPATGRARAAARPIVVRCRDHRHLSLPLPLFDVLMESWS